MFGDPIRPVLPKPLTPQERSELRALEAELASRLAEAEADGSLQKATALENDNPARRFVAEEKAKGVPLWDTWLALMNLGKDSPDIEWYMNEAAKIEDLVVDRNLKGIKREKNDNEKSAIRLYEANLRDHFDGSHPYERLRIIYQRQGRFLDAIRVCEAYVARGQPDPIMKEKYERLIRTFKAKAQAGKAHAT